MNRFSVKVVGYVASAGILSYLLYLYYRHSGHDKSLSGKKRPEFKIKHCGHSNSELPQNDDMSANSVLSRREAHLLTNLISPSSAIDDLQKEQVLNTIANKAAFTENQNLLREAGCLRHLTALMKSHSLALAVGSPVNNNTLRSLLTAVNNLAVNDENQAQLQECIPALFLILSWCNGASLQPVKLSALQVLTNLAVTSSHHNMYINHVDVVAQLAVGSASSSVSTDVTLQALRLLVNLTLNPIFARQLTTVQHPSAFLRLLKEDVDSAITLRALTILVNLHSALTPSSHRVDDAIIEDPANNRTDSCSPASTSPVADRHYLIQLRLKLQPLCRHGDQDVRNFALRLASLVPAGDGDGISTGDFQYAHLQE